MKLLSNGAVGKKIKFLVVYDNILISRLLTVMQMTSLMPIGEATTVWQLYSQCSSAFVQIFLKHANARGQQLNHCLSLFLFF